VIISWLTLARRQATRKSRSCAIDRSYATLLGFRLLVVPSHLGEMDRRGVWDVGAPKISGGRKSFTQADRGTFAHRDLMRLNARTVAPSAADIKQ
jgi:hypothetical protein